MNWTKELPHLPGNYLSRPIGVDWPDYNRIKDLKRGLAIVRENTCIAYLCKLDGHFEWLILNEEE